MLLYISHGSPDRPVRRTRGWRLTCVHVARGVLVYESRTPGKGLVGFADVEEWDDLADCHSNRRESRTCCIEGTRVIGVGTNVEILSNRTVRVSKVPEASGRPDFVGGLSWGRSHAVSIWNLTVAVVLFVIVAGVTYAGWPRLPT